MQIPWALTAVAAGFHLNGVSQLKLTGKVLAEIYLGQITTWSDPQIRALNRGVKLPNIGVTPIYRVDASGDTYAFTGYLGRVSAAWATKVGHATTVTFPSGMSGRGNSGVVSILNKTNGGIAYVAAPYLIAQAILATAAIQNAAGAFAYPNLRNIESAARRCIRCRRATPWRSSIRRSPPRPDIRSRPSRT